jgi:hypothetical protein
VWEGLVIPNEASPSQKLAILAVQRGPCLRNPLSVAFEALSMAPAVPDRRACRQSKLLLLLT